MKLTKLPAPDPLAATRILICLVKSTTSPTVKKYPAKPNWLITLNSWLNLSWYSSLCPKPNLVKPD